jgi:hypothetical protein
MCGWTTGPQGRELPGHAEVTCVQAGVTHGRSQRSCRVTLRGDVQGDARQDHETEPGRQTLVPSQGGIMVTRYGNAKRMWCISTDRFATTGSGA